MVWLSVGVILGVVGIQVGRQAQAGIHFVQCLVCCGGAAPNTSKEDAGICEDSHKIGGVGTGKNKIKTKQKHVYVGKYGVASTKGHYSVSIHCACMYGSEHLYMFDLLSQMCNPICGPCLMSYAHPSGV